MGLLVSSQWVKNEKGEGGLSVMYTLTELALFPILLWTREDILLD